MASPQQQQRLYTPEEYLALERETDEKNEYYAGHIYAMSGATRSHNRIADNVYAALHAQLRGRPCEAFGANVKVRIPATGLYTYPDASALCGDPRFDDDDSTAILLNPNVLVEVLSKSTEAYDRGEKFSHYQKIQSLQEYVLFAQDHVRAERYVRDGVAGDRWVLAVFESLEATVELPSIGCELLLRDAYERVEFSRPTPLRAVYEDANEPATSYAAAAAALRTPAASSP